MTTVDKKKEDNEKEVYKENLYFHLDQELVETEEDLHRLQEILENEEIDDKTKASFKKTHDFYEKLKKNNFSISLEEISRD